jgi:membrane-associated protease RseP (regulator of RpoE activity)
MPVQFEVKLPVTEWFSLLTVSRAVTVRGDEIVQGILYPEYDPDHPRVRAALDNWDGTHFLHQSEYGTEVTLMRPVPGSRGERWWLHLLLGALTTLTMTIAGAYFAGRDPLRLIFIPIGPYGMPLPVDIIAAELLPGLIFSVPLLVILLGHELGHYVAARWYRMNVSPPYFIPAPPWLNIVGTFGAFIRLRSVTINRLVLLDVGAAGPLASLLLSVPAVLKGAEMSRPIPGSLDGPTDLVVIFAGQPIWLGGSLLFDWLAAAGGGAGDSLVLHPLAFAGWLGLFVTAMNLFPLAQLDGGHIAYALMGGWQRYAGLAFLAVLAALGTQWWGWWLWAGLILVLGRGTIAHPPVFDESHPVPLSRRIAGWACLVILVLTFVTIPIEV